MGVFFFMGTIPKGTIIFPYEHREFGMPVGIFS